jgi:hypothetical protein
MGRKSEVVDMAITLCEARLTPMEEIKTNMMRFTRINNHSF